MIPLERRVVRAAGWALLPLALGAAIFFALLPKTDPQRLLDHFNSVHVEYWHWEDATAQNRGFLACLAAVAGVALLLARRGEGSGVPRTPSHPWGVGAALLLAWVLTRGIPLESTHGVAAWLAPPLLLLTLYALPRPRLSRVGVCVLVALASATTLPFLYFAPSYFHTDALRLLLHYEDHYFHVLTRGERLGGGAILGDGVITGYGPLWTCVVGLLARAKLELPWSFYLHVVGFSNVVFSVAAVMLAARAGRDLLMGFLSLPFILGWTHFAAFGFQFPNQSAFRYLGIPLVLWTLWRLRRETSTGADWKAMGAAGLAILWNPETGIALGAGTFVFLLTGRGAEPVLRRAASLALKGLIVGAASVLLVCGLATVASGHFPKGGSSRFLALVSEGAMGHLLPWSPAALTIGFAALVQILCSAQRFAALRPPERFRLGAAVACLVWFGYWINAPDWLNLKGCLVLFPFFGFEALRLARASLRRMRAGKQGSAVAWVAVTAVGTGLAPVLWTYTDDAASKIRTTVERHAQARHASLRLSGVLLHPSMGAQVSAEAAEVRAHLASIPQEPLLILTRHPMLIPKLVGRKLDLPFGAPFSETYRIRSAAHLIDSIRGSPARHLIVDRFEPRPGPGVLPYAQHFETILEQLRPEFELERRLSHLDIYRRRDP